MSSTVRGRRFRQLLIKRIAAERGISPETMYIEDVTVFPAVDKWGSIGVIDVSMPFTRGRRRHALYGFDALAEVACYAD